MNFKSLTIGSLPRVLVRMLAMCLEDRSVLCEELRPFLVPHLPRAIVMGADNMAENFAALLDLPKEQRRSLVVEIDRVLDELDADGFFGRGRRFDPRRIGRRERRA